jgi:hypothetical protein
MYSLDGGLEASWIPTETLYTKINLKSTVQGTKVRLRRALQYIHIDHGFKYQINRLEQVHKQILWDGLGLVLKLLLYPGREREKQMNGI